ncbi:MAG: helicase HerA-like domain-containing protein [Bacteroidia bacterium]|nr:helicase HerA-like domain-containing protein [Bacteroidia bacterium]
MKQEAFQQLVGKAYTFEGDAIELGGAMLGDEVQPGLKVRIPLRTLNRHGLIAGATGTGKTKTLQMLAEQLSRNGVSSLLMDIKGDLSGIAMPGTPNPKIEARHEQIGIPFEAAGNPVELLSLSDEPGLRLRATVTEFGPVLFSKILDLTEVQASVVAVVFKYCDDQNLPLVDLDDFKKTLQYLTDEGKEEAEKEYGRISTASTGTIFRKLIALEQQGAARFFGEPSFEVADLCRVNSQGQGMISILRVTDLQDRPQLFATFMMSLLAEIYASFPELGDPDRPELVLFIDEAHLIFDNAPDELLDQIESVIKLIRSKGIGIFFCTQNPIDVPEAVLGQLGLKVQHALRAFTAKDRQAIKLASQNFPETEFYEIENQITALGIGEAFVTALNEKGIPTPLVHTRLRAPGSRMDVLTESEIAALVAQSKLASKYNREVNRESAHEILSAKIAAAQEESQQAELKQQQEKAREVSTRSRRQEKSTLEQIASSPVARQVGRTVARELTRGLLGVLGLGGGSSRKKKGGLFF